jgi:hypothetical protein
MPWGLVKDVLRTDTLFTPAPVKDRSSSSSSGDLALCVIPHKGAAYPRCYGNLVVKPRKVRIVVIGRVH